MNEVAAVRPQAMAQSSRMAVADIISHVALVQEVMRAVMKPDVHYGVIPGTDKPTLYKQGAEVLCMAFRVADSYQVEDLSTPDVVRYRVTCTGVHQMNGLVLGTGMGEASSGEEKYKWRKAWDEEFEATPANLRRIKSGKYKTKQVRTESADLANTILKMANKRAKIAMTINVTACGDMFGQDLEDMDEALRDHLARHGEEQVHDDQPAVPTELMEEAVQAASNGLAAYQKFWQATGAEKRKLLAGEHQRLKQAAADADKGRMVEAPAKQDTKAPTVTYASVMDRLLAAKNQDALSVAADWIQEVPDPAQRAELTAKYEELQAKFEGNMP